MLVVASGPGFIETLTRIAVLPKAGCVKFEGLMFPKVKLDI